MSFSLAVDTSVLADVVIHSIDRHSEHVYMNDGSWLVGTFKFLPNKKLSQNELIPFIDSPPKMKCYLDRLCVQYFAVFYSCAGNCLYMVKDFSGCEPGYYRICDKLINISDSIDSILQSTEGNSIDELSAFNFVYFEMPWKPKTLFDGVLSVLNGVVYSYDQTRHDFDQVDSFRFDELEPVSGDSLREKIALAHERRLGVNNAIYLSGGVDSQVMGISLVRDLGQKNIQALNFSVLGARESEQEEAKQTAKNLGIEFNHVSVDPSREVDFESVFLKQNSPYLGAISIDAMLSTIGVESQLNIFGGQDTRLHTPALSRFDLLYWFFNKHCRTIGPAFVDFLVEPIKYLLSRAFSASVGDKVDRSLELFSYLGKPGEFLAHRHFHIHNFKFLMDKVKTNPDFISLVESLNGPDFGDPRNLYNRLVLLNWRRQYMFDIEYMVGVTRKAGHECVMPFYDEELAHYSSAINFAMATKVTKGRAGHSGKPVKVNKYVLREAYKGELDDSLIYRDKAVCPTSYMFFNGALKQELNDFIFFNPLKSTKLGESIFIEELIDIAKVKHLNWKPEDNSLLVVIFNAMVLSQYYKRLN